MILSGISTTTNKSIEEGEEEEEPFYALLISILKLKKKTL